MCAQNCGFGWVVIHRAKCAPPVDHSSPSVFEYGPELQHQLCRLTPRLPPPAPLPTIIISGNVLCSLETHPREKAHTHDLPEDNARQLPRVGIPHPILSLMIAELARPAQAGRTSLGIDQD